MTGHQIKQHADEMGISLVSALRTRIRYLLQVINEWDDYINGITNVIPPLTETSALFEIIALREYESRDKKGVQQNEITPDMVTIARNYPIENVVEFNRGVALAFCHADKRPSLTLNRKTNTARCYPCDKSFDAIQVKIERDGLTFPQAVRFLQ